MAFALFGKKSRKNINPPSIGVLAARGDSMFDLRVPNSGVQINPQTDAQVAAAHRKHQAEMSAKIDAIESEMAGEFIPIPPRETMPRRATQVPRGVELPSSVKRELPQPGLLPTSSSAPGGPPTLPPLDMSTNVSLGETAAMGALDVFEVAGMAPAIEEAAILFANGQRAECEQALKAAIANESSNREAWLLLFELLQQSCNAREFDSLAMEFSVRFESSPPAWRVPQVVKPAAAARSSANDGSLVALPAYLDAAAVRELDQLKRQLKQAHRARLAFDAVTGGDDIGAQVVLDVLRQTALTTQELTLTGVEPAVHNLRGLLVAGERSQPESLWLLALELYHLLDWERQFEDLSVDYSISFEVSPPQHGKRPTNIVASGAMRSAYANGHANGNGGKGLSLSLVEAEPAESEASVETALKGEVTGKAVEAIAALESAATRADVVEVDCSSLCRVDFSAAGSLLNWLMAAQSRNKQFVFREVNQLVAALFGVMGMQGLIEVHKRKA